MYLALIYYLIHQLDPGYQRCSIVLNKQWTNDFLPSPNNNPGFHLFSTFYKTLEEEEELSTYEHFANPSATNNWWNVIQGVYKYKFSWDGCIDFIQNSVTVDFSLFLYFSISNKSPITPLSLIYLYYKQIIY